MATVDGGTASADASGPQPVVDGSELGALDAVETAALIRAGDLKSSEVVGAAIERARAFEPALNAVATPLFEEALRKADEVGSGDVRPFAGVPSFVKSLDSLAGVVNDQGSRAFRDHVPKRTEKWVARMLETGFLPLGTSNASEGGLSGTTEPLYRGATHNPWKLGHTPGGSSGGSAALVASRVVPLAHAADGGGSIRIPAAYCGLVGLKPSRERLFAPTFGELLPLRIITYGALTRTVRDTAHFVHALERRHPSKKLPPIGLVEGPGNERLRIGFYTGAPSGEDIVDPEIAEAVRQTGRACEALGHRVEEIPCPYDAELLEDFWLYWGVLAWGLRWLARAEKPLRYDPRDLEPWTHGLAELALARKREVLPSIRRLRALKDKTAGVFDGFDLLLCPTTAKLPPKLGHLATDRFFDVVVDRQTTHFPFTPIQNGTGRPAISLPVAQSRAGLPIGAMFEAPHGHEAKLLEIAYALEGSGGFCVDLARERAIRS